MQRVRLKTGEIVTVTNNHAHTLIEEGAELVSDEPSDTQLEQRMSKKIGKATYGNTSE